MYCICKYDSHVKALIYFVRMEGSCIVYTLNPGKAMRFCSEDVANDFAIHNLRETFVMEVDE